MTVSEVISIVIAAASLISALSIIYGKLVRPIKKVMDDVQKSKENLNELHETMQGSHTELKADIKALKGEMKDESEFASESREVTMKSLIAILDGLEQTGANGAVTKTKKELVGFMAKNLKTKK